MSLIHARVDSATLAAVDKSHAQELAFRFLHGDRDQVVPIASGQQLYKLVRSPKRFVRIPGGGHDNLSSFGISEAVQKFVAEKFD